MELDVRVSSIPGVHGESLVLRLLPKERADMSLLKLGMERDHLDQLNALLQQPRKGRRRIIGMNRRQH